MISVKFNNIGSPGPVLHFDNRFSTIKLQEDDADKDGRQSLSATKFVSPEVLQNAYNMNNYVGNSRASQVVLSMLNQNVSTADLSYFQSYFNVEQRKISSIYPSNTHVDMNPAGCSDPTGDACSEANLDTQYLMSTAQQTPTSYMYFSDVWKWIIYMSNLKKPPLVSSISYG